MIKNLPSPFCAVLLLLTCFCAFNASAQLSFTGQLRDRAELRDGYGTLESSANKNAAFISQRTRLILDYKNSRLIFHTSIQDVRLWGQDASTISNADGSRLGVHEAWAELILSNKKDTSFKKSPFDYFAVKIGRQELVYDDERLLGNADWLQQGRRHDAVVFKLIEKGWQVDLGGAFNQNSDAINYNGTYYTPANIPATIKDSKGNLVNTPAGFIPFINSAGVSAKNGSPAFLNIPGTNTINQDYKAMQFLYIGKKFDKTLVSALFLTDQFAKYKLDSVKNTAGTDVGYVYGRRFNIPGVNLRYTTGLFIKPVFGDHEQWNLNGSFYYQGGHDKDGNSLSAYSYTASVNYKTAVMSYMAGWDYLSGNNSFSTSTTSHRFDPLYGSPHRFWGTMDYFYATSGSPTGGLNNPYLKVKFTSVNKRFTTELANHYFFLADNQKDLTGNAVSKYLGTEFDLTNSYKLNKFTNVDLGLSYMAATHSMEYAKGITPGTARLSPFWAYLQLNIKPEFLNK
ncbi:alginate export family protein [Pedobacter sp. L105]|uniref:alginate export family protein n=1 Tax=Pedobacter sp. L105 TaxID=1641871 RepID=UPI00131DEAF7|nr:alginate export family protein [Pedobacter sp. L105]